MSLKILKGILREKARKKTQFNLKNNFFLGFDVWNLYELSWLNLEGIPQLALGIVEIDSKSINLIESKSFKFYLHELSSKIFFSKEEFAKKIKSDLKKIIAGKVIVNLFELNHKNFSFIREPFGLNIDNEKINFFDDFKKKDVLYTNNRTKIVKESLYSNLLKSNCPITNQPDWASIEISYKGFPINRKSLLLYLINFRNTNKFHEDCVEKIFTDIMNSCYPIELTVYARYNRRGGIDINPWRSNKTFLPSYQRLVRQ